MAIGRRIGLNDDKGYMIAIFLALVIIASLLAGYYLLYHPTPSGYSTLYLLDSQNKAVDYPQLLVANQNSTFTVPIAVVNNMGWTVDYQVQVKIATNLVSYPVNVEPTAVHNATVKNGQTWHKSITVTENQVGNYWVVFELYTYNPADGTYKFTYDYGVLPIQVVSTT
jgi:uncharacterized membrane protein